MIVRTGVLRIGKLWFVVVDVSFTFALICIMFSFLEEQSNSPRTVLEADPKSLGPVHMYKHLYKQLYTTTRVRLDFPTPSAGQSKPAEIDEHGNQKRQGFASWLYIWKCRAIDIPAPQ
jgi:hypothetical protein